ncbi:MAG: DMT family transporter [Clostridia bacterium]|nr:DMT family transporter [Clostridia bacterium]
MDELREQLNDSAPETPQKKSKRFLGVVYIILSAFFFALMSVFVRLAGDLPTFQKSFFRNLVAALVAFVLLLKSGSLKMRKGSLPALLARSVAGTVGIVCNFYAIDHMNVADASILNKLAPFFSIVFSALFLKEKASPLDWIFVFVAFGGALFVVKPSLDIVRSAPALLGVLGGLGAGLAYTFVHYLGGRGERTAFIVFFFSAFSCLAVLPFTIADFQPMTTPQILFLLLAGCAASCAQFSVTAAYSRAPAKEISVYDYSQVLFAALWGLLLFSEIPDLFSFIGYAIIIGAAVLKYFLTARKHRKSRKNPPA